MNIVYLFFLNLVLMLTHVPFAYSVSVAGNLATEGRLSSEEAKIKQESEKKDLPTLDLFNSSDGSLTTREGVFSFSDDGGYASASTLSPRSVISDITFDNSTNRSVGDSSSDCELENYLMTNLESGNKTFHKAVEPKASRAIYEDMSDQNLIKVRHLQKRGKEWLESKAPLFNAINNSLMSLIKELEIISEEPKYQIKTSVYLVKGYKNVYDDAIAIYEDFLRATSGYPINENTLKEATKKLVDDMIFSIDRIVSCVDKRDFGKYRILFILKENIKNWKYTLKANSQITASESVKFRGGAQKR